jgi:mono/diheme cytochrome c family protein
VTAELRSIVGFFEGQSVAPAVKQCGTFSDREVGMNAKVKAILLAGAFCVPGLVLAVQDTDLGKYEYQSKCASCHGISGKGDGALRTFLVNAPADLTTYARRNGGAFPTQLAWEVIDGRPNVAIGAHGTREMPIWGQELRREVLRAGGYEVPNPEWFVAGRITALIDYLATFQVK